MFFVKFGRKMVGFYIKSEQFEQKPSISASNILIQKGNIN